MKEYSLKKKILIGSCLAVCFAFTVLFYGPVGLYINNSEELSFGLGVVLKNVAILSIIAIACIILFSMIVPSKLFKWYMLLFLGVLLGFYVQGNYINYSYGVLDGTEIEWSKFTRYGILNTAIWAACILIPFIVYFVIRAVNKKKKEDEKTTAAVNKFAIYLAIFIILIQIPALITQVISYKPKNEESLVITKNDMFNFSDEDNIIVFCLDTIDGKYLKNYMKHFPDFEPELDGFTNYVNTMTGGARTMVAMPIMFTGIPYERDQSYSEYIDKIYSGDNVLKKMSDAGYDVRIYSETLFYADSTADYVSNFELSSNPITSDVMLLRKLYKLTLFRFMPHFLKARFWMQTSEFEEAMHRDDKYLFDDAAYYEEFQKNGIGRTASGKKTFTVYHMRGAHRKYDMDENGIRIGISSKKRQIDGSFKIVRDVLQELKNQGLYDKSTIILTADHGDKKRCQWIMFMLKEKGATGPMKTSHAPISSFDFPVYYTSLAGQTMSNQTYAEDLLSIPEDEQRTRYLFYNTTESSKLAIFKYKTEKPVTKFKALTLEDEYIDSGGDVPYKFGTKLMFDSEETGNAYVVEGFGKNHGFRTKAYGPIDTIVLPLEEKPDEEVTLKIGFHNESEFGFDTIIKANDIEIFHGVIDQSIIRSGLNLTLPMEVFEDTGSLKIDFLFPEISQDEMQIEDVSYRTQNLSFVSMEIE
ncbi:MAG: sulfatase-like hydrolase/transferase [Eubacterium sp.]|nr:sulfatase-like hydrolase/transferase [Eubacterium sp.]